MKCTKCKYHLLLDNTYYCNYDKQRPKRISIQLVDIDLFCSKLDRRRKTNKLNRSLSDD